MNLFNLFEFINLTYVELMLGGRQVDVYVKSENANGIL